MSIQSISSIIIIPTRFCYYYYLTFVYDKNIIFIITVHIFFFNVLLSNNIVTAEFYFTQKPDTWFHYCKDFLWFPGRSNLYISRVWPTYLCHMFIKNSVSPKKKIDFFQFNSYFYTQIKIKHTNILVPKNRWYFLTIFMHY